MSRVDQWIIPRKRNRNRINGRTGCKGTNNARKMLGKPMLRRIHLVRARIQYGKKILNGMYMYGGKK